MKYTVVRSKLAGLGWKRFQIYDSVTLHKSDDVVKAGLSIDEADSLAERLNEVEEVMAS